jgi:hypothetical protein
MAGHVACLIGRQKHSDRRDVFRLPEAPERDRRNALFGARQELCRKVGDDGVI